MKKIWNVAVCCGANIATSTIVTNRVDEWFRQEGIKAKLIKCRIGELGSYNLDFIISTTSVPNAEVPVFIGTPFVANINTNSIKSEILQFINNYEE